MKTKKLISEKEPKSKSKIKVLGVTANIRNILIAIALIFGFLSGFFQVYNWVDTTYTRVTDFRVVKAKQDFSWENDILKGMYSRYYVLDSLVNLAPDPTKVPENLRKEFISLGKEITLQEDKVKLLQKNLCK